MRAPESKSAALRALACASLAPGLSTLRGSCACGDALAAMRVASGFGAEFTRAGTSIHVDGGILEKAGGGGKDLVLSCGESGLCLRMFSAIAALLSRPVRLVAEGSLTRRSVAMVEGPLRDLGAYCATAGGFAPVEIRGPMRGGAVRVDGRESSQFVSGLLMALPLAPGPSTIWVDGLASPGYVDMTLETMRAFGVRARASRFPDGTEFLVPGGQAYGPREFEVEGDWSGAAFLLIAAAIAGGELLVEGLRPDSLQPDRAVLGALGLAGASAEWRAGAVLVRGRGASDGGTLRGFEFDASGCPDLFPPLVALASRCAGRTALRGVSRLRDKESDRALTLKEEFGRLGMRIDLVGDAMIVSPEGSEPLRLRGGPVSARGDHRVAMAAAVAGLAASGTVLIEGASCVAKSYPRFFDDLALIGARLSIA